MRGINVYIIKATIKVKHKTSAGDGTKVYTFTSTPCHTTSRCSTYQKANYILLIFLF